MNSAPPLNPPWISDRQLSIEEVDALKLLAPAVLQVLDAKGIDVLTEPGGRWLPEIAISVAEKLGMDDAQARGLSMAVEVAAVQRKFS